MNINNFLDIWDIWVNELVGSVWLFVILGLVFIVYLSAKFKFSVEVSMMVACLFLIIVFIKSSLVILWVFVLLGVGALFYYIYQKTIR